jgi:polyvinyl alcohol dehydrogenase (cytochrome)
LRRPAELQPGAVGRCHRDAGLRAVGCRHSHIRAYSVRDGRVLWDYDMAKPFTTVNDVTASGGSLDAAGPTVAGGLIFVNAGYGLYGSRPGNVLAAFAPAPP